MRHSTNRGKKPAWSVGNWTRSERLCNGKSLGERQEERKWSHNPAGLSYLRDQRSREEDLRSLLPCARRRGCSALSFLPMKRNKRVQISSKSKRARTKLQRQQFKQCFEFLKKTEPLLLFGIDELKSALSHWFVLDVATVPYWFFADWTFHLQTKQSIFRGTENKSIMQMRSIPGLDFSQNSILNAQIWNRGCSCRT